MNVISLTGHDGKKRERWEITANAVTFLDTPPAGEDITPANDTGSRSLGRVTRSAG